MFKEEEEGMGWREGCCLYVTIFSTLIYYICSCPPTLSFLSSHLALHPLLEEELKVVLWKTLLSFSIYQISNWSLCQKYRTMSKLNV